MCANQAKTCLENLFGIVGLDTEGNLSFFSLFPSVCQRKESEMSALRKLN